MISHHSAAVELSSRVRLFAAPWAAAGQASLSFTVSCCTTVYVRIAKIKKTDITKVGENVEHLEFPHTAGSKKRIQLLWKSV